MAYDRLAANSSSIRYRTHERRKTSPWTRIIPESVAFSVDPGAVSSPSNVNKREGTKTHARHPSEITRVRVEGRETSSRVVASGYSISTIWPSSKKVVAPGPLVRGPPGRRAAAPGRDRTPNPPEPGAGPRRAAALRAQARSSGGVRRHRPGARRVDASASGRWGLTLRSGDPTLGQTGWSVQTRLLHPRADRLERSDSSSAPPVRQVRAFRLVFSTPGKTGPSVQTHLQHPR